jgi:hypothetical protein
MFKPLPKPDPKERMVKAHNGQMMKRSDTLDAMWKGDSGEAWIRVFIPKKNYNSHLALRDQYYAASPVHFDEKGEPYQTTN